MPNKRITAISATSLLCAAVIVVLNLSGHSSWTPVPVTLSGGLVAVFLAESIVAIRRTSVIQRRQISEVLDQLHHSPTSLSDAAAAGARDYVAPELDRFSAKITQAFTTYNGQAISFLRNTDERFSEQIRTSLSSLAATTEALMGKLDRLDVDHNSIARADEAAYSRHDIAIWIAYGLWANSGGIWRELPFSSFASACKAIRLTRPSHVSWNPTAVAEQLSESGAFDFLKQINAAYVSLPSLGSQGMESAIQDSPHPLGNDSMLTVSAYSTATELFEAIQAETQTPPGARYWQVSLWDPYRLSDAIDYAVASGWACLDQGAAEALLYREAK